ncbi:MAG: ribosome maturation factor RimM [Rhizobiales bacterium]|nr:ribosome maturation factor RimM [Hyphomicrobiales bacterium]
MVKSDEALAGKVCLGVIVSSHGVRGLVRVKPFTEEPMNVGAYGPVETGDGKRRFAVEAMSMAKGLVLCRLEGVNDRDMADALRGTELYVPRERLPEPEEDEDFYQADLIGLETVDAQGRHYGRVLGFQNFGAGDLIEIDPVTGGASVLMPFTADNVPAVDMEARLVIIDPPLGLFEDEGEAGEAHD